MLRILTILLLVPTTTFAADPTVLEADARLRQAFALARDMNDREMLDRILGFSDHIKRAFARKDIPAVKLLLRDAETFVGLDPGSKTMHGMPVAQLTGRQRIDLEKLTDELTDAFAKDDAKASAAVIKKMHELLGDQAGIPDSRRKGELVKDKPLTSDELAELFIKVLHADPKALKALQQGIPNDQSMPRAYASVLLGCVPVRANLPAVLKEKEAELDATIAGCCKILVGLQLKNGFFKYPDLRDKHVRYGAMIEALVAKNDNAIEDGWVTQPDPLGETLYDVGECGIALLQAGTLMKNDTWKQAGLKAADWVVQQPCCATFHHNAYAVSLLCEAYRVTKDVKYRDAAWKKYTLGVVSGQVESGRWLDPLNSRSTSLFTILRAQHDLQEVLPAGAERDAVRTSASKVLKTLRDEMDQLLAPMTSYTLQELVRHATFYPDSAKELQPYIQQVRALLVSRSNRNGRIHAVVPLPELAALLPTNSVKKRE